MSGRIVLVGTPIGNLGDLSPRAGAAFADADVVACEDTRRTGRLLAHLGVRAPQLVRLDEHTEHAVAPNLVERAGRGETVVVASDAGMPVLSDPGATLVALAAASGVVVELVPGPFAGAVAAALSTVLDDDGRFCFEGFLPRSGAARSERLDALVGERRAIVCYEAPHRLRRTLADLQGRLGDSRRVAIARELTKLHEEVWRGTLAAARERWDALEPRGEFVVVVAGSPAPAAASDADLLAAFEAELQAGSSRRDAAASVARRHGVGVNRVKGLTLGR